MAEVQIQRKEGAAWWPWLLAALVLGGLIWWIVAANRAERIVDVDNTPGVAAGTTAAPTATTAAEPDATGAAATTTPGVEAAHPALPVAAIHANPDDYFGQQISGLATVTEVVGERGFWIEKDGKRLFVVKDESLVNSTSIVAGRQVSFTGTVVNPDTMREDVPGIMALENETLTTLQGEPAIIRATNIEMQDS